MILNESKTLKIIQCVEVKRKFNFYLSTTLQRELNYVCKKPVRVLQHDTFNYANEKSFIYWFIIITPKYFNDVP